MLKILLGVGAGLLAILLAVYFGYLFISGEKDANSMQLLIPSVFLVIAASYSFFRVIKLITLKKPAAGTDPLALAPIEATTGDKNASMLQKNNALINDYKKTTETQDKLKMLQAAGAAEEQ